MLTAKVFIDTSSIDDFVDAYTIAAGKRAKALMEEMGRAMVVEVRNIVESELPTTRRKKNTTRLSESFTYRVESGPNRGGFPYTVHLTVKPGVDHGKIGALNYGVTPRATSYYIYPRNVPLALRFQPGTFVQPDPPRRGKYAGQRLQASVHRVVTSGPPEGIFFLERARDIVLDRYGYTT